MNAVETFLQRVRGGTACRAAAVLVRRIDVVKLWDVSDRKAAPAPPLRCGVKLQTKVREDFTITISWLQVPSSAFSFHI